MAKTKETKAEKHETKGDAHALKGKHDKAVKEYKKALDLDPENAELLEKLISARDMAPGEWGMQDFADSVGWAMKKQEKEHPSIRQVHARLTPEWKAATGLAVEILSDSNEATRGEKIEKLVSMGEIAARAMIGLLLDIKNPPTEEEREEEENPEP